MDTKPTDAELDMALSKSWAASEDIVALLKEHGLDTTESLEALSLALAIITQGECKSDESQAMWWVGWVAKRFTTLLSGLMERPDLLHYRHRH
jgi:hypothetical protein